MLFNIIFLSIRFGRSNGSRWKFRWTLVERVRHFLPKVGLQLQDLELETSRHSGGSRRSSRRKSWPLQTPTGRCSSARPPWKQQNLNEAISLNDTRFCIFTAIKIVKSSIKQDHFLNVIIFCYFFFLCWQFFLSHFKFHQRIW